MIDDAKHPREFLKNDNTRFNENEVTLVKTYSDGLNALLDQGPWDILLLDWHLNEFSRNRNGLRILQTLQMRSQRLSETNPNIKVDKIIVITSDNEIRQEMLQICKRMKEQGLIKSFEAQHDGKITNRS